MPIIESTINSLKFAETFTANLDKVITREAVTGFMLDNALRAHFVGARTVKMPDIDMIGLADYDRGEGYKKGGIHVGQQSFTLSMDRGRQLTMDREDMDETGVAGLASEIMEEFVRLKVTPEIDAYTLSKLAQVAIDQKHAYAVTSGKPFADLLKCESAIRAEVGYTEELVALADDEYYYNLMVSNELGKTVDSGAFKKGEIDMEVKRVNGTPVLPVPSNLMKTMFEFTSAEEGFEKGFVADSNASKIHLLVLPKKACSLVKKTENMRIFTPEQNKDADAYVFNYRVYYDAFVKKSKLNMIHAVLDTVPTV